MSGGSRWLAGWLATALVAAAASPGDAQEADFRPWSATVGLDVQQVRSAAGASYWQTLTTTVARKLPAGSLAFGGISARRHDRTDLAGIADLYGDLWEGAYGNVRVALAPRAEILSRIDIGAEIFHSIGAAEVSLSARSQEFETARVRTFGLGTGYYSGDWFLRPRGVVAQVEGSWSPFVAFTGRRYLGGSTDDLIDLSLGGGAEVLEVTGADAARSVGVEVVTSASRFGGIRLQRYFGERVGLSAGAWYSDYDAIHDRWGVSAALTTRW